MKNQEITLTIKLKKLGAIPLQTIGYTDVRPDEPYLWTIKSAFAWLREKGWKYGLYPNDEDDLKIVVYYRPIKKNEVYSQLFEKTVLPGHELEGLLECMIKIVEKKNEHT